MKEVLSRSECSAMRGIAIMAIMLHNYCHFIGRIVKENEYLYLERNNERLWHVLSNPNELLPVHLLSYFGQYGVPVFLFLSGFGLVLKYEGKCSSPNINHGLSPVSSACIWSTLCIMHMETIINGKFSHINVPFPYCIFNQFIYSAPEITDAKKWGPLRRMI